MIVRKVGVIMKQTITREEFQEMEFIVKGVKAIHKTIDYFGSDLYCSIQTFVHGAALEDAKIRTVDNVTAYPIGLQNAMRTSESVQELKNNFDAIIGVVLKWMHKHRSSSGEFDSKKNLKAFKKYIKEETYWYCELEHMSGEFTVHFESPFGEWDKTVKVFHEQKDE